MLSRTVLLFLAGAASIQAVVIPRSPSRLNPRSLELKKALAKRQSTTSPASSDSVILNFALALELVDISLFNGALANFTDQDFTNAGFPSGARGTVERIAQDEEAHAEIIRSALTELGVAPVEPCQYTFPYTDVTGFLGLSAIIEGVGTSAYIGSLSAFTNTAHTTTAGGILGAETRHNALLRYLNQESPNAGFTDTPLSAQAVTSLAAGFFVPGSCPSGSALPLTPFPALNLTTGSSDPTLGTALNVVPAVAFSAEVAASPIYCGFTSGVSVQFTNYTNSQCTVPSANQTFGQTYLALTSTQSLSDSSVLAGIAHFNLVNSSASFLNLERNTTSTGANSTATKGTGSGTGTGAGNALGASVVPLTLSMALAVMCLFT